MISISEWLKNLDLEQYTPIFVENEVDFRTLQILTDNDLKELGLPFGPRKRLLDALANAKQPEVPPSVAAAAGERRQLTVMFCDMVGFTELAHRVDPEVLQNIIRSYEDACAVCITRYDGYVFQRLGDGIVAFFGFPLAHEGEAERAIRAGLEIVDAMASLDVQAVGHIQVRIGIATGIVVVTSRERGAVGETMNLAARLQSVAKPGNVVVSERVHRLASGAFNYEDLGEHDLKGIARPTRAYRVLSVGTAASRFDAATGAGLTPFVGREHEIDALLGRWQLARKGAGQAVLLSGEPGIGKSRIVNALRERIEVQGIPSLRFQCSPFYINSAFHPIIAHFERALNFGRDEPAASRLDKLEALVVGRHGLPLRDARFIAAMLSIPYEERYGPLAMNPRLIKAETDRVWVDIVKAAARAQPCLMLFEDLHWADPTTLEVLGMLIEQLGNIPLLVVLTSRGEVQPQWSKHPYVSVLNLSKLTPAQSSALISGLAGGKALPAELAGQIAAKTDGVPLFVEELTKAILESGDLIDEGDRYVYAGTSAGVSIPETLRDLLTARLDRVGGVKEVAQAGAVIGREFSYELISALNLMPEVELGRALTQLTESELAFSRGTIPDAVYTFKHALVQDAAYDSLLKSQRQPLHGRIARVLEERWPETRDTGPELLAHHYTAAGLNEAAIPFWRRAGQLAMQRFALPEAVSHLRSGMTLIETLPGAPARDLVELEFRTVLAPAVVAQRGWGHSEVSHILEPAWALAESLDHRQGYVPILNALWVHYMCRDQLAVSLQWAEKLFAEGAAAHDDSLEIVGHRAASASYFWLGNFVLARKHGDMVHSLYDSRRHWHVAQLTNNDPLTGEGIYRAQYLWMLGYPDQAVAASNTRDEHARRRNHPFDLAFALTLGAQAFDFRCEPGELLRRTEEAERIGREHGVTLLWEIMAEISLGIAWLRCGRFADSVVQLEKAIARLMATGHRIWVWYLRALQAEGLALTGDLEGARALIDESVKRIQNGEERSHYAEVLRLRGWLLMQQGKPEEAEADLRAAIDVARHQQAKSWELRSAATLARLLADRGDRASAHELLFPVYGWFTEGFDTKDLREAKALLDVLQS
jgi:class 3 adenylate cyclase/tetratricopeptide (TPR) repeat protein